MSRNLNLSSNPAWILLLILLFPQGFLQEIWFFFHLIFISLLCLKSVILLQKVKKVRQPFDKIMTVIVHGEYLSLCTLPPFLSPYHLSCEESWNKDFEKNTWRHWDRHTWTCIEEVQVFVRNVMKEAWEEDLQWKKNHASWERQMRETKN